jgi:hypothetical protein
VRRQLLELCRKFEDEVADTYVPFVGRDNVSIFVCTTTVAGEMTARACHCESYFNIYIWRR